MKFHQVEPEVAGGWGEDTVARREPGRPPVVERLHHVFDGWMGDELLETTPCFIVTEGLAEAIRAAGLSGVTFDAVEVGVSETFVELQPATVLPSWVWMKVEGVAGRDDFGLSPALILVVSDRALAVLGDRIVEAVVSPF